MVYLASVAGQTPTNAQISSATRTPAAYLAKVVRSLARAGLLRSQRGLHGGSSIARAPDQITIHDVVQAVDPIQRITTCPLGLKNHGVNLCPLHRRLDDALGLVSDAFKTTTLAERSEERRVGKEGRGGGGTCEWREEMKETESG